MRKGCPISCAKSHADPPSRSEAIGKNLRGGGVASTGRARVKTGRQTFLIVPHQRTKLICRTPTNQKPTTGVIPFHGHWSSTQVECKHLIAFFSPPGGGDEPRSDRPIRGQQIGLAYQRGRSARLCCEISPNVTRARRAGAIAPDVTIWCN